MMSRLRKLLDNWIARVFFVLLFAVFVFWGISNVFTMTGSSTAVAHVDGKPVDVSLVQAEYQKQLNQAEQSGQSQPDLPGRQKIAQAAMTTVLRKQVLAQVEHALGLTAPDAAEAALEPCALFAVTVKVYAVPSDAAGRSHVAAYERPLRRITAEPWPTVWE